MSRSKSPAISNAQHPSLTRSEVAKKLNVSVRHVQRLVEKNILREHRLRSPSGGRSMPRYSQADLDACHVKGQR